MSSIETRGIKMDSKKIYNTTVSCPVCNNQFPGTKVRLGSYRILSHDSDFAVNYEGVNPILYDIFVCNNCGYAAYQDHFDIIRPKDKTLIATQVYPFWKQRSYSGERTLNTALQTYKLALYLLQLRDAKSSEIAKTCLRIAWLYRWKGDPRETEFLQFALEYYSRAYQIERFPLEKMDDAHCTYLIAELHRKLGNLEDAAQWFGKLFSNPQARQKRALWDLAHEQYQLVKNLREKKG
jgi:uncharacterized protein (DUF2225 family)